MSLNTRFSNCFNFINNMKDVIESDRDRWDNIYMEHSIVLAECDLMEMEIEAAHDAEMYDSIMNGNASRKGRNRKAKQNGKRNADKAKRYHCSDRNHGKTVPQSDKKYMDSLSGTFYRWDEKRKTFDSHKKPVVHKRRKTFRDRLNARMEERELDFTDSRSLRFAINKAYKEADDLYKEINKLTSQPVCDFIAPDHSEDKFKEFMNEYSYLCEREKEAWTKASELHDLLWIDED